MATRENKQAPMVVIEFDRCLFSHFNVAGWNAFVDDLIRHDLMPVRSKGMFPPAISVQLNLAHLRCRNYRLNQIDFGLCRLTGADFGGASLKGALFGDCPRTSFKSCRLHGAVFTADISGCDFTDATGIESVRWVDAYFTDALPPVGLTPAVLARCKQVPAEPQEPHPPKGNSPSIGLGGAVLRCCATINFVPVDA